MKAVQVMFDETLLCELDAEVEVKKQGRSAVLRRLVADYLERRREAAIDARYRQGYAGGAVCRALAVATGCSGRQKAVPTEKG